MIRAFGRRSLAGLALASLVGVCSSVTQGVQSVSDPASARGEAEHLVTLAQHWLGGADRVADVRSLELVGRTETHRVLLPDRYELRIGGNAEAQMVRFDGRTIRREPPIPERRLQGGVAAPPEPSAEEIRMQGLRTVATYALQYLVRTLPTYPMHVRLEQSAACAGVSGACLEFVPENGSSIFMVIDAHTGQPRAIVTSLRAAGSRGGPMTLYSVDRLYDYRPVDGLQVPFRVERQVTGPGVPDLGAPAVETYDAVRVNPPLIAADFAGQ